MKECLECRREAKRGLVRAIRRAKASAWRDFLTTIEEDPWGRPYKLVMNKLRARGLPPLTEALDPSLLATIIGSLFPGDGQPVSPNEDLQDLAGVEVLPEEVRRAAARIGLGRAPGPDGVPGLEAFSEIIKRIKSKKEVCASFSVLNPFIDSLGIISVGGRLAKSNLPYERRHPALLPKDHAITNAIIREKHFQIGHGGTQATLNAIRESFLPINGRSSVKRVIYKCIICRRLKPTTPQYPANRLYRPFLHIGVDFCGPLFIKEKQHRNRGRIKIYVAVFVCFSTKAVHLELMSDLTTEAFLAALHRFMARRGKYSDIYSDNAKNFVGSANELEARVSRSLANEGIKWHFIPPRSPHFGGLWKAAVKSFKHHLVRIVGDTLLGYEALLTNVLEIEAILNSRPGSLSNNPNDLRALTPGHLLIDDSFTSLPEDDYREIPSGRLSQWKHVQQMKQHFWNRWNKEYLNEQTIRKKWHRGNTDDISSGTLVILRKDNSPPLK
ncbi:uncharacterized protein LOC122521611 [Polistes fuscatus]|uniref:uncharacterized protein LOC122521611 n=1 Tax=Polistes fuscatus TaxID=30207 RepID=UPI001CA93B48|nr:uncharacterized protein LOC122521611 [Polistes fuscatus]